MDFKSLLRLLNEGASFYIIFPAMVFLGIYLSIKLRFVQISKLKLSFSYLIKKEGGQGNITHYEAISAVLAGNLGTGNISGMAVAIATGGPGALVWMWVMSLFGSIIQYSSCLLGIKYRKKNEDGEYVGGPMYYLSSGAHMKKLASFFAIAAILAALMVGNFAQVNSITLPLKEMGLPPLICGLILAVLTGFVILGGIRRFARLASSIVPIMALFYLGAALYILYNHKERVADAFTLMIQAAFKPQAVLGGGLGFTLLKAVASGFERGVFATDAGTGLAPILQASAQTKNPVVDAVVTLVAPFLVMVVCSLTGMVILVTDAWDLSYLQSTNMVTYAFEKGLGHVTGKYIVITALFLFAYTTILAWCYCAEKAWGYLFGNKQVHILKWLYIGFIPLGALAHVDLVWLMADITISFMLCLNLYGVMKLSTNVIGDSREFFEVETLSQ